MASMTIPLDDETYEKLSRFSWINWSEVARQEATKKEIFERFLKTGNITDDDWIFCEEMDWHPVDELPFREKYLKKLDASRKQKPVRMRSVDDLFK